MLQNIREAFIGTTGKVVLGVILLLLAGTGLNYTITPRPFVAKVDGEEISLRRVNAVYRQLITRFGDQQLPPELLSQVQAAAVNQVVTETALAQHLRDSGYAITDAQVAARIREIPDFQTDGAFDPELYRRLLAQNSLSPAAFEADERQRMVIEQLRENVASSAFVTPEEFRRIIELSNEEREVEYAVLPPSLFIDDITVTDAEVASWYESNPARYRTEASADVDYVLVDRALARERVDVDAQVLRDWFEANAQAFTGEEERRARWIVLRDDDGQAARAEAEALLARIRAGEPFEDLARSNSQDPSASQGGDLGWLTRGVFPGPVEDTVFSMSPGEVSDVIDSEFGYLIIRVDDVRSGDAPTFEAVADEVRERYVDEREAERLLELEERLADQLFEADTLEQIASALDVELQSTEGLTEGAAVPFGVSEAIDELVFGDGALEPGTLSDVIELPGDRSVILRVTDRTPAGREPLEAVADEIREELRRRAASRVAEERGTQIAAALNSDPDAAFEDLLADADAEYVAPKRISRNAPDVPAALAAAVFGAEVGPGTLYVGSVSAPSTGFIVYRISDVVPGDPSALPQQQIEAARQQYALQRGSSDVLALTQAVLDDTPVKIGTALEDVDGF